MISASEARELTPGVTYTAFRDKIEKRIREHAGYGRTECHIVSADLRGPQISDYVDGKLLDNSQSHVSKLVKELAEAGYEISKIKGYSDYRDSEPNKIKISWS
jgi:hypothetical protein